MRFPVFVIPAWKKRNFQVSSDSNFRFSEFSLIFISILPWMSNINNAEDHWKINALDPKWNDVPGHSVQDDAV